jgi:hypothetical protein
MGEVLRFIPKSELQRALLIREARAIYENIFPTVEAVGEENGDKTPSGASFPS